MESGIYQIKNNITGKIYIGSSDNFQRRRTQHFWHLQSDSHSSMIENSKASSPYLLKEC